MANSKQNRGARRGLQGSADQHVASRGSIPAETQKPREVPMSKIRSMVGSRPGTGGNGAIASAALVTSRA